MASQFVGHQLGILGAGHEEGRPNAIDEHNVLAAGIDHAVLLLDDRRCGQTAESCKYICLLNLISGYHQIFAIV